MPAWIAKGGFMMWPILLCSVIALGICIQKAIVFISIRLNIGKFIQALFQLLKEKHYQDALSLCRQHNHPIARAFLRGLENYIDDGGRVVSEIEISGMEDIARLDRGLKALSSIVTVLPMLGFLGTIIGLIQAFMQWETMGENVTVTVLAGGIYAAMITTAAGLFLAIPYFMVYNYFVSRIERLANDLTRYTSEFVAILKIK